MNQLALAILLFFVGQTLIWVQTNGQFLWKWFDKNPLILSVAFGTIISYAFILGTKYIVGYFDGLLWPGRFIGFACGNNYENCNITCVSNNIGSYTNFVEIMLITFHSEFFYVK
jgi:hypothetical protein